MELLTHKGRLQNKVAVITGSSRGIGREIAAVFAREGAAVVVNFRTRESEAINLMQQIIDSGQRAICHKGDISDRSSVCDMFAKTVEAFGRIDILVNNAGINHRMLFEETTDESWDSIMSVNLKGTFICCQEVFRYMKNNSMSKIINISSVAGQYHGPETVHYAVSKAGIISLTKVLARYGAPHNILVNAVAPGLILTDQTEDEFASPAAKAIIDMTLLKRPGSVGDVASACLFLAEDKQNYITGQVISISGGAYLG